ncbi:MAG: hypothetical protein Q3963_02040, partial [Coriobacteriaceae bacterium]|nr:hypothetical protein [Coriobacteriaceae bacterium]
GAGTGAAGAGTGAAGTGTPAANTPPATEEILDQDTPLAQTPEGTGTEAGTQSEQGDQTFNVALIAGLIAALAAALAIIFYLVKKRNEEQETNEA